MKHPRCIRLAVSMLVVSVAMSGCAGLAGDARVRTFHGMMGAEVHFRSADSVCASLLIRDDTTDVATTHVIAGPFCFDAATFIERYLMPTPLPLDSVDVYDPMILPTTNRPTLDSAIVVPAE